VRTSSKQSDGNLTRLLSQTFKKLKSRLLDRILGHPQGGYIRGSGASKNSFRKSSDPVNITLEPVQSGKILEYSRSFKKLLEKRISEQLLVKRGEISKEWSGPGSRCRVILKISLDGQLQ